MTLAAPVPVAPPAPPSGGIAPRLLEVKADASGKIMVTVLRTSMEKVAVGGVGINPGGAAGGTREVQVSKMITVELGDVKDLKVSTADGKKVEVADAVKQLKDGGVVVVSADGKPVNPNFLKVFKDDVLVLASPELAGPLGPGPRPFPGRPLPPGGVQPLPAPLPPQALPVNPGGVIQIQIQPGQIQVIPLNPAPAPAPVPEK